MVLVKLLDTIRLSAIIASNTTTAVFSKRANIYLSVHSYHGFMHFVLNIVVKCNRARPISYLVFPWSFSICVVGQAFM